MYYVHRNSALNTSSSLACFRLTRTEGLSSIVVWYLVGDGRGGGGGQLCPLVL